MKRETNADKTELRRTELLGWYSVGIVISSLIPAVLILVGLEHLVWRILLVFLLVVGLLGLMIWYLRVRYAIRRLSELTSILEKRSAEQEVSLKKLEELEKVKKAFMHMASHQLRAPLAALQSCLRVLLTGNITDKDDSQKLLHDAYARGEDMMELVNDILLFSEAESLARLDADMPLEEVEVEDAVREIADFFAARAAEKNVEFAINIESSPDSILVNRKMFNHVILNLVSNAFRYSYPDRKVTITLSKSNDAVIFRVHNWGLIVNEEDKQNLFREFWRGKDARKFVERGTGLGLSIVKNIVDIWGGWIGVESDAEHGTCFTIEIPKITKNGGKGNGKEKNTDN
ncbi:MAG: HAMP domain-containing sensor histidine kinase [bacterium]